MVKPRICSTFFLIVVIFVNAQFVDSRKHRSLRHTPDRKQHAKIANHHHHHHHHHHHQQHRHLPLAKKHSRSISRKSAFSKLPSSNSTSSIKRDLETESPNLSTLWIRTTSTEINGDRIDFVPHASRNEEDTERSKLANIRDKIARSRFINSSTPSIAAEIIPTVEKIHDATDSNKIRSSTAESIADVRETESHLPPTGYRMLMKSENYSLTSNRHTDPISNATAVPDGIRENTTARIREQLSNITTGIIEAITETTRDRTMKSLSSLSDTLGSSITAADSRYNRSGSVREFERLFGSTKTSGVYFTSDETPVIVMIRKKRSAPEETKQEPRNRSLRDFRGPAVSNDPEEPENWRASNAVHKRVKRDRPMTLFETPSALSYLRDLEDSFAPSALEIRAERLDANSQGDGDSFVDAPRLERNAGNNSSGEVRTRVHMRTKRFGPVESSERSSEQQPDTSVESEDNRIIDSMLMKVDDGNMVGRDKRDTGFSIRGTEATAGSKREKRRSGRRKKNKKQRKKKKKKKKKKHRNKRRYSKIERSPLSSRREDPARSDVPRGRSADRFDGRPRGDNADNFDANESSGLFQRDSADVSIAQDRFVDGTGIREKREGPDRRVEYYVAENTQGPNGTSQITDKKAARHIRDIEELVEKLLVKVSS